jgi:diacylglycerol O-acyltransferase / wax synthase
VLSFYPLSIVVHGVALNITVQSYDGRLDFGLIACRRAMPEVRDLAQQLQAAFDELQQSLVKLHKRESAAPRKAAKSAKAAPRKAARRVANKDAAPQKRVKGSNSGKAPLKRASKALENST